MSSPNCKLCNGKANILGHSFSIFRERELLKCRECEVVWRHPLPTEVELEEFYQAQNYFRYPESVERSLAKDQYQFIKRCLSSDIETVEDLKFIEIGSGNGHLLEEIKDHGHDATGYEIDEASVNICRKKGLDVRQQFFNEQEINGLETNRPCVIIFSHVLEHLADPIQLLRLISFRLKKSYIFIEVPDGHLEQCAIIGDRSVTDSLQQHLWSLPSSGIEALVRGAGITPLFLEKVGASDYYTYTMFVQAFHKCLDDEVFNIKNSGLGFIRSIMRMPTIFSSWTIKYLMFKSRNSGRKKYTRAELPALRFFGKIQ